MTRRIYWGLAILIILLIGVTVVMLTRSTDTTPKNVYIDVEPSMEIPPPAEPGYKWVWHHNQWNKVPTARPGDELVRHGDHTHDVSIPHTKPVAPMPNTKSSGGLTYHAELLETDPVKALRLQTEERGHWSARWIPEFPPDDIAAQEFVRNQYLLTYYKSIGDMDNSIYRKAWKDYRAEMMILYEMPPDINDGYTRGRGTDLLLITWTAMDQSSVLPLYNSLGYRTLDSNHFPDHISNLK